MKCPKCSTTEGIKWFLRHQQENDQDESTLANVITILCTNCGENQTFFLADCLDIIFSDWAETLNPNQVNMELLAELLNSSNSNMVLYPEMLEELEQSKEVEEEQLDKEEEEQSD